jgi:hypothetical protein
MNDWLIWFQTGVEHILDIYGYDHMLFVLLLTFTFPLAEWKKLVGLITAFTVGHSLTLALSVLNIISVRQEIIELLIILTILTTALVQLLKRENTVKGVMMMYGIICCFGLIHGLGFSYLLKSMLSKNETIIKPLLWFNVGLEAGQLIFVGIIMVVSFIMNSINRNIYHYFKIAATSMVVVISVLLLISRTLNLINA